MALFLRKVSKTAANSSARCMATISFAQSGVPAEVLRSAASTPSNDSVAVGSVRVAIKASAVNVEDVRAIHGVSLGPRSGSVAGSAGSGTVSEVARGDGDFSKGDTVFVLGAGTWSDEVTVSKDNVVKLSGLSAEEGAALPSYIAAWGLLHNVVQLKEGDVVVQTLGSSAVGTAVSQVGKALGLKVVSLADADVKGTNLGAKLQEVGAYKLAITGQSGKHISSLQRHGVKGATTVIYDGAFELLHTAVDVQLPISHMIFNGSSVSGFDLQSWARGNPSEYREAVRSVAKLAQDKKIALKPAHVFPQAEYLKAIEEVTKSGAAAVLKH